MDPRHDLHHRTKEFQLTITFGLLLIITALFSIYTYVSVPVTTSRLTEDTSLTANWQTYTNITYGYSFKYPSDRVLSVAQENLKNSSASVILDYKNAIGDNYPTFYVDVFSPANIPADVYNYDGFMSKLPHYLRMKIGETVTPANMPFNYSWTRKGDITVNNNSAYVFSSSSGEKRVVINKNNYLYVIGGYGAESEDSNFNSLLATFDFTK